jgi:hypothetical protein
VVVGETNKNALLKGLGDGGLKDDKIKLEPGMKEALSYLAGQYCAEGDVVLIENDLPDIYESVPVF